MSFLVDVVLDRLDEFFFFDHLLRFSGRLKKKNDSLGFLGVVLGFVGIFFFFDILRKFQDT